MGTRKASRLVGTALGALAVLWPGFAWAQQKAGQVTRAVLPAEVIHTPAKRGQQPVTVSATPQQEIYWNDTLQTGDGGRVRAQLTDGSILSLGSKAKLKVEQHDARSQQSSFNLEYGRVRAQVVRLARPDSRFEIRTNTAVLGVLGTDEVVDASSPVATLVLALDGVVLVRSSDPNITGSVTLTAGQATTVEAGKPPQPGRPATQQEIGNAVQDTEGTTNPQASVNLPVPQVEAGKAVTIDGRASTGGLGGVAGYLWQIPKRNFSSTDPVLNLDTTGWTPGLYEGSLTVATADGKKATTNFRFTVIASADVVGAPEEILQALARAYESKQVGNFMKLFNAEKYAGIAALEETITKSFANIADLRVYVRKAVCQTTGNTSICQADFEIRFTPRSSALPSSGAVGGTAGVSAFSAVRARALAGSISGSAGAVSTVVVLRGPVTQVVNTLNSTSYTFSDIPDGTYTVRPIRTGFVFTPEERTVVVSGAPVTGVDFTAAAQVQLVVEQVTLRLESGSGWRITGTPQGNPGSAGLVGIPGTNNPNLGNTSPPASSAGQAGGGAVAVATFQVSSPGTFSLPRLRSTGPVTVTFTSVNGFVGNVQIAFTLPTGITVAGPLSLTLPPNAAVAKDYVFSAAANANLGQTVVSYTATSGNIVQSGSLTLNVVLPPPPVLNLPANITAEATSASGAAVSFAASATDPVDGSVPVTCTSASGATFSLGTTTVTCTATNRAGSTATGGFQVTVRDTTPPALTVPGNLTAEATGASGAAVTFSASATDLVSGAITPVCTPASGSTFPLGTTTVTCTATDAAGNNGTGTFQVTVRDSTPPALTLPGNITAQATSAAGAVVNFTASAADLVGGSVSATCTPASGSTFPQGTTTVNCTATDGAGNRVTGSFQVTVADTTAPVLSLPANITLQAASNAGTVATYSASATDAVDGTVPVSCTPASGSTFPLGTTTVTCTATDKAGNRATGSFTVTVSGLPTLSLPGNITAEATSSAGAVVTFTVSATDPAQGTISATCTPPSGSTFPLGTTTVNCTATNSTGGRATGSFTVTVKDTTPPALSLPAGITVQAAGPSGATVSYTASATDLVDGSVPVSCSPASGATFPVGTTTVACTAADKAGNTANGTFSVTVTPAALPVLAVSPTSLTFSATQGGSNPTNQTLSISNAGSGTLSWTATASVSTPTSGTWLSVSPSSGTAPSTLTVSVNISGLVAGNYSGSITVTGSGASSSPQSISVSLTVAALPAISLSASSLTFSAVQGGANPANQTVNISNSGGGTLNWTATAQVTTPSGGTWLSVSPSSGTAPSTLTISVNLGTLAAGTYSGTITVAATGASNSPQTINVTLTLNFTMSAAVKSGFPSTIAAGGQGTTVSVTVTAGTGVTVTVTPPTVTGYTITPPVTGNQVTGSGVLDYQIKANGGLAPTTSQTFTFTGTSTAGTQTASVALAVVAAFTLSGPSTFTMSVGTISPLSLTLTLATNYTGSSVTVFAPLASGPVIAISPGTINNGAGTYTFQLTAGATSGSVNLTFQASDSFSNTASATVAVTVSGTLPAGGGTVSASSAQGTSGGTAAITVAVGLASGVSVDTLSFGLSITPNGAAPALTGALSFSRDASMPVPDLLDTSGGPNVIAVSWLNLSPPLSGTVRLGQVVVNLPSGASGQSYTVTITGASGSLSTSSVTLTAGPSSTLSVLSVFVPLGARSSGGPAQPDLYVNAGEVTYTPAFPREGEIVRFRVRVSNRGESPARDARVALLAGDRIVATERLDVPARRSAVVELEWKAEPLPARELRVRVDAGGEVGSGGREGQIALLRNFVVERRGGAASVRRERLSLTVRNDDCAGLRLLAGTQTSCGGSADLELAPGITDQGRLELMVSLPEGGLLDLGVQPLSTIPAAPTAGYQPQGLLESGHVYAIKTRNRYALLRFVRASSTVDPRLGAIDRQRQQQRRLGRTDLNDLITGERDAQALDRVLDSARITIDLEWLVQQDGSANFQ